MAWGASGNTRIQVIPRLTYLARSALQQLVKP